MVVLRPVNLRWIDDSSDDPADFCAHGDVEFRIADDVLLDGSGGRNLTVSAAALYLLRTLSSPHVRGSSCDEPLFPCCGFNLYDLPGDSDVAIAGCGNGTDFEIVHQTNGSGVIVCAADGRKWSVGGSEWCEAVFGFAGLISDFYANSSSKQPAPDDVAGFAKFVAEWDRRWAETGFRFGHSRG